MAGLGRGVGLGSDRLLPAANEGQGTRTSPVCCYAKPDAACLEGLRRREGGEALGGMAIRVLQAATLLGSFLPSIYTNPSIHLYIVT